MTSYDAVRLLASLWHIRQCPLEIGSAQTERVGQGEVGGWVHPKGANSMTVSGLGCRKALVGTRRVISVTFGFRNEPSHLVGPPFPVFKACFQLRQVGISREP